MNVTVNNRFGVLLAEKRMKEKRSISLAEVAKETELTRATLYGWQNNTVKSYSNKVINALCNYFEVQPGDLFEHVPD